MANYKLPCLTTIGAFVKGRLVSAHLLLEHAGFAYSHLAASAEEGHAVRAAYPISHVAIQYYSKRVRALDFAAGAGEDDTSSGLSQLKEGFSNMQIRCFLAGKILDADAYAELCTAKRAHPSPFYSLG